MTESSPAVTALAKTEVIDIEARVIRDGPKPIDRNKRCAIVGFASSSRNLVDLNDEGQDIISLNHAYQHIPAGKWKVWYEMHPREFILRDIVRDGNTIKGPEYFEWLRSEPAGGRPIYMQKHFPEIPASVAWPREEVNAWFSSLGWNDDTLYAKDYYTSTISQMLALAMYEGYGEIGVYGVDLLQDEEYFYQRAGCEYLIGLARGRGHKVYVPEQSALCKAGYTYGYSEVPESGENTPMGKFLNYVSHVQKQIAVDKPKAITTLEAIKAANHMVSIFKSNWVPEAIKLYSNECSSLTDEQRTQLDAKVNVLLKSLGTSCDAQLAQFQAEMQKIIHQLNHLEGQEQGFDCSISWAKHLSRGGELVPNAIRP